MDGEGRCELVETVEEGCEPELERRQAREVLVAGVEPGVERRVPPRGSLSGGGEPEAQGERQAEDRDCERRPLEARVQQPWRLPDGERKGGKGDGSEWIDARPPQPQERWMGRAEVRVEGALGEQDVQRRSDCDHGDDRRRHDEREPQLAGAYEDRAAGSPLLHAGQCGTHSAPLSLLARSASSRADPTKSTAVSASQRPR